MAHTYYLPRPKDERKGKANIATGETNDVEIIKFPN